MRKSFFWVIMLAAALGSCTKESIQFFPDDASLTTPYGTWKLVSRENYATNQVFYKEPGDVQGYCNNTSSCDVVLTFSQVNSTDIITGNTISNTVTGDFAFNPVLRQLSIFSFGGTKLGEPQWSYNIWDNMHDVGKYKVTNQYLRLYLNSKQESLTFIRQ